jgi:NADPH:quinone reductase-like Zn-dependent oxidoreductase
MWVSTQFGVVRITSKEQPMYAIRLTRFGGPDVLELIEVDEPVAGPGQILIRVESAAVNFADVMRRRNDAYPFPTPLPFIPGSEVAGTVEALGAGVEGPAVGTSVFAIVGADGSTGYAQYALADAHQVVPIPAGMSTDEAAGILIAGTTAMLILTRQANLVQGESVLIGGAGGGVGTAAIQIAKSLGAGIVIGAASTPAKRDAAIAAGADRVVDPTAAGWEHTAREHAGGGVDVVLEMSGGNTFAEALSILAPFGRLVVYGIASGEPGLFSPEAQHRFLYDPSPNQSIHVFNIGLYFAMRPMIAVEAMTELIGLVASGQVEIHVGDVLPLAHAGEAHRRIEARESTGKIILRPWA